MYSSEAEHETKYVASKIMTHTAFLFLKHSCRPDPLYPISIINSIYFDTFDHESLNEKINSDFLKSKFRIRWYDNKGSHQQTETCFAEIKAKYGARRNKERFEIPVNRHDVSNMRIEDPRLMKIPNYLRKNGVCLVENLIPLFLIRYERHRFIERAHGFRVCMDFNICVPKVNRGILPDTRSNQLDEIVVEVKGPTRSLPETLFFLSELDFKKASFSKYERCYKKMQKMVN